MADSSAIEWTGSTWNPTTGCDRVSPGCDHCYALTLARRLQAMGSARYQRDGDAATSGPGFGLTMHLDVVDQPLRWSKPRLIFVNSMSDLLHDQVTDEFIAQVFAVMALTPRHTYQVLTKRHGRLRSLLNDTRFRARVREACLEFLDAGTMRGHSVEGWEAWPCPNVWIGVSAETQKWADIRVPALLSTPAAVRFVSAEPLLGPIDFAASTANRGGLDWVITGGESGAHARPCDPEWVREIRDWCATSGTAFFHKQWGGRTPKAGGRELDGRIHSAMPASTPARTGRAS